MHKIRQSEGFLGRLLKQLLKTGLPFMKSVLRPLAKSVFIPLGLTAAASATDATIQNKIFGYGMAILIISNEEMNENSLWKYENSYIPWECWFIDKGY